MREIVGLVVSMIIGALFALTGHPVLDDTGFVLENIVFLGAAVVLWNIIWINIYERFKEYEENSD